MKLRYLPVSGVGPVLLFEYADPVSARALITALEPLGDGQTSPVRLDAIPEIESVDGCQLIALASSSAAEAPPDVTSFLWCLKPVQWQSVAGLIEPFAAETSASGPRHQYLGQAGPATVIISTTDQW